MKLHRSLPKSIIQISSASVYLLDVWYTRHCFLDKAAILIEGDYRMNSNPWMLSPVTRVDEVKMVISLLPIWATTIIFWTTYAQMITFSVEQAFSYGEICRRFPNCCCLSHCLFCGSHTNHLSSL